MTITAYTCALLQINEQFSGSRLSEAQVFSIEISNAAGSRLVNYVITFIQLLTLPTENIVLCNTSSVHLS